jgi:hypothetical protein
MVAVSLSLITGRTYVASKTFSSGYSRDEILGCNCRVLNGPGTSLEVLEEVRTRII